MKFIHMGDVHLGAEPESGTSLGKIRKAEIWESFKHVLDVCEQEQVELLLIPGDLFHSQPLLRDVKEVDYLFSRLTKTKVVMIAGNHDCLLSSSHYYEVDFPNHVTFLMDTEADSVYFPELNTEVFGLSYETRQIKEARYDSIRVHDKDRINILLAHGNTLCNDKSVPIHRSAIESAGFDYVALGHLHNPPEISERIAYSGSLEPLNRGETGKKGYIRGEIIKNGPEPAVLNREFVPCAKREYVSLSIPVTPESTELSVCETIGEQIKERGQEHIYMVTLSGKRAMEIIWDTDSLGAVLQKRGQNVIEIKDETIPDFQVERIRKEQADTLAGRFIESMDAVENTEIRRMALQYGLQALFSRDEKN